MNSVDWIVTTGLLGVIAYGMWAWYKEIKAQREAEDRRQRDKQEWIRQKELAVKADQLMHIERITARNKAFAAAAATSAKAQVKHVRRGPVATRSPSLPIVTAYRRRDDDDNQVVNNIVSAAAGFALAEALSHAEETTSRRSEPVFESGGGGDFGGAGASGSWGESS